LQSDVITARRDSHRCHRTDGERISIAVGNWFCAISSKRGKRVRCICQRIGTCTGEIQSGTGNGGSLCSRSGGQIEVSGPDADTSDRSEESAAGGDVTQRQGIVVDVGECAATGAGCEGGDVV